MGSRTDSDLTPLSDSLIFAFPRSSRVPLTSKRQNPQSQRRDPLGEDPGAIFTSFWVDPGRLCNFSLPCLTLLLPDTWVRKTRRWPKTQKACEVDLCLPGPTRFWSESRDIYRAAARCPLNVRSGCSHASLRGTWSGGFSRPQLWQSGRAVLSITSWMSADGNVKWYNNNSDVDFFLSFFLSFFKFLPLAKTLSLDFSGNII